MSADEELIELFFESTKKQGGGPVKNVKILRDKNVAFVEFWENMAVETVMKKRPLKFGITEIDIQPYKPLLKGSEIISNVDIKGLPNEFTEVLVKKRLDWLIHPVPVRDYEAEHFAFGSIKVGSRVVRGRDWRHDNQDRGGKGTVTRVNDNGTVTIKWDYGATVSGYSMGKDGKYTLKLA